MEDVLKPLLDAELQAQSIVDRAFQDRDRMVEQAQEDVRVAEERFAARIPELHASFVSKAEERADQAIAELERRYQERCKELETMAEERRLEAIEGAVAIILDASGA
jgi:V/A-type H+-transporting ATPase subunit G/H